jgi:hypothetical protein
MSAIVCIVSTSLRLLFGVLLVFAMEESHNIHVLENQLNHPQLIRIISPGQKKNARSRAILCAWMNITLQAHHQFPTSELAFISQEDTISFCSPKFDVNKLVVAAAAAYPMKDCISENGRAGRATINLITR